MIMSCSLRFYEIKCKLNMLMSGFIYNSVNRKQVFKPESPRSKFPMIMAVVGTIFMG